MDYLSTDGKEKLQQTGVLIGSSVNIAKTIIAQYGDGDYEEEPFLFIKYTERFTYNLESINLLLTKYEINPNFETAIGLLIRPSLLDFLVLTYLVSYKADIKSEMDTVNREKYREVLRTFFCDHLHHAFDFLKNLSDVGLINSLDYRKAVDNLIHDYNPLFTDSTADYAKPANKLLASKKLAPLPTIFKRLANHQLMKDAARAYDQYTYFSKYEHFGVMTTYMQGREGDADLYNMLEGIRYIHWGLHTSISCLPGGAGKHKAELQNFLDIIGNFEALLAR